MECPNCRTLLLEGANACPTCGMVNPLFQGSAGRSPYGSVDMNPAGTAQTLKNADCVSGTPTVIQQAPTYYPSAGVSGTPTVIQQAPTYYPSSPYASKNSNPYDASAANPYGYSYGSSPYQTDTPPPPPATKKRKHTTALVVVLCVVLLVLVGGSVFVFAITSGPRQTTATRSQATPTQSQATQQSQPISPAGKQAFYDKTIATTPVMNDSLSGPDNYGLDNYTSEGGKTRCFFSQSAWHAVAQPTYFSPCYATATNYQNFVLQVKMAFVSGHSGGLVFRADSTNDKGYQFRISTDGTYLLNRIILDQQGNPIGEGQTLMSGSSELVQKGTMQANQLGVMAQGETISLFINGKYVDSATDGSYHSGQVGVYVDSDAGTVEGVFKDLQVWKLA